MMCVLTRFISVFYKVEDLNNLTWFHEVCSDEQKVSLQNKWTGFQITGRVSIGQVIRDLKKVLYSLCIIYVYILVNQRQHYSPHLTWAHVVPISHIINKPPPPSSLMKENQLFESLISFGVTLYTHVHIHNT